MEKEQSKVGLAILITALVVGGAVYYFTNFKAVQETTGTNQENSSYNQSSKEYAVMGRELWSAFSCSTWASHSGDQKEAERLFLFGYKQGKSPTRIFGKRFQPVSVCRWRDQAMILSLV